MLQRLNLKAMKHCVDEEHLRLFFRVDDPPANCKCSNCREKWYQDNPPADPTCPSCIKREKEVCCRCGKKGLPPESTHCHGYLPQPQEMDGGRPICKDCKEKGMLRCIDCRSKYKRICCLCRKDIPFSQDSYYMNSKHDIVCTVCARSRIGTERGWFFIEWEYEVPKVESPCGMKLEDHPDYFRKRYDKNQ